MSTLMLDDANPFATRFVRPGAIEFLLPAGGTFDGLVDQLDLNGWRGQILGPHGTGKSTLLRTLEPYLEARLRALVWFTQTNHQRSLAVTEAEAAQWNQQTLVIVDGYEQLSWLARHWLTTTCDRASSGLLIATHTDMGFPTIFATQPSVELACDVVEQLTPLASGLISVEDVSHCYQRHAGNLRETLFALYDLYELRRMQRS